jgi:DNA recombination-dependent growth factor C
MGLMSRSASIMRYRAKGEMEGSFWDSVEAGVKSGAFKPVESPGDEIGVGWTTLEDFTDAEFRGSSYVRGNYVALSLRVDTVRVPARVLEMEFKKESRKLMEQLGTKRLSSGQRRELKERLKETMRKQVFPSIQTFDLIWDTAKAVVYFGSHSVKARERMEGHFKKSFGLTLVPLLAFLRGGELLASNAEKEALEQLKPCSMMP